MTIYPWIHSQITCTCSYCLRVIKGSFPFWYADGSRPCINTIESFLSPILISRNNKWKFKILGRVWQRFEYSSIKSLLVCQKHLAILLSKMKAMAKLFKNYAPCFRNTTKEPCWLLSYVNFNHLTVYIDTNIKLQLKIK